MPSRPPLLATLSKSEREQVLAAGRPRAFDSGEVLMRQGALGDGVLLLVEGSVKVVAGTADRPSLLALRGPGELVGELAALDGRPRSADVIALAPGHGIEFAGDAFRAAFADMGSLRRVVAALLTSRVREGSGQAVETTALKVNGRMAARVLDLAERFGVTRADGAIEIDPPISRTELASWAGGSREAGARAMRALREAGWIAEQGRLIVVLDRTGLERLANR